MQVMQNLAGLGFVYNNNNNNKYKYKYLRIYGPFATCVDILRPVGILQPQVGILRLTSQSVGILRLGVGFLRCRNFNVGILRLGERFYITLDDHTEIFYGILLTIILACFLIINC